MPWINLTKTCILWDEGSSRGWAWIEAWEGNGEGMAEGPLIEAQREEEMRETSHGAFQLPTRRRKSGMRSSGLLSKTNGDWMAVQGEIKKWSCVYREGEAHGRSRRVPPT